MKTKIILLTTEGDHLNIAYNYLSTHFTIDKVIVENSMSKKKMLSYRVKKLGLLTVFGQVLFIGFSKVLTKISAKRKSELVKQLNLSLSDLPQNKIEKINTVNSNTCREKLKNSNAKFIFVVGTRIIGKKTLSSVSIPFVNSHAGITPKYRGVHGGYWALKNKDIKNCGVTIHYVDTGVDTGDIIAQETIKPTNKDNFTTYPILQQHKGFELLIANEAKILNNVSGFNRPDLPTKQWFHPTLWGYLFGYLLNGVK